MSAALDLLAAKAVADVSMFLAPDGTPMTLELGTGLMATGRSPLTVKAFDRSDYAPRRDATTSSGVQIDRALELDIERPYVAPDLTIANAGQVPSPASGSAALDSAPTVTNGAESRALQPSAAVIEPPDTVAISSPGHAASQPALAQGDERTSVQRAVTVHSDGETLARELGIPRADAVSLVSSAGPRGVPYRFKALYVALARSSAGRALSPAVRAARALALARTMDASSAPSTRARTAAAWAVMPMLLPGHVEPVPTASWTAGWSAGDKQLMAELAAGGLDLTFLQSAAPARTANAGWQTSPEPMTPASLSSARAMRVPPSPRAVATGAPTDQTAPLSAGRAGESLAFLVPSSPGAEHAVAATPRRPRGRGALTRPPTAAPPLVHNGGRPSTDSESQGTRTAMKQMIAAAHQQRAMGNAAVPSWFEKAARHIFEDTSGAGGGVSLAEMTLVASVPEHHIAAAPRTASASPAAAPASPGGAHNDGAAATPDVEAMAMEVYAEICRLMEISRERNGEPWR